MGRVGEGLTDFGKRASIGATLPIVAGFGLATKAASDLSEQVNKTDAVFGDAAAAVHEFAEGAARDIGQSQRQAEEAVGTFGNLFNQLGIGTGESAKLSVELTRLASDFASFHNADPSDVLIAMTAAFRGEYDAVQRFVPVINAAAVEHKALELNLATTSKELTAQDKALATNALLLEGAGRAVGDFDRTQGGLANQTRILRAELEDASASMGLKLIPVALKLANVTTGLLQVFDGMPDAAQNLSLIGLSAIAAVGPISFLAGNVLKLRAAITATTAAAAGQSLAAGAAAATGVRLAGALTKVGLVGAGLFAVTKGIESLGNAAEETEENVRRLVQATDDQLVEAFRKLAGTSFGDELFGKTLEKSASDAQRLVDVLNSAGIATGNWQSRIDASTTATAQNVVAQEKDAAAVDEAAAAIRGATSATGADTAATDANTGAVGANAGARGDAADAAKAYADAVENILDATVSAANAELSQQQATAGFADALDDVAEKERELTEARRERTSAARDAISEERALNSVEDARSSVLDAERELAEARRGRGRNARDLADAEKALVEAQREAAGARGMDELARLSERVAEAQERVNEAREAGGAGTDVADATEALSRAQLDARDAELSLSEQREERAERERTAAAGVKAAEDALAAAHLNAQTAALQAASAARELAAFQAESIGKPLTLAAQYRIYRDALIEIKDTTAPGGELRRNLEGVLDDLPPSEVKIGILADTVQPNAALEALRQQFQRFAGDAQAQGPTIFGPVGAAVDGATSKLADVRTRMDDIRVDASRPFVYAADTSPVISALGAVRTIVDNLRADTGLLLASLAAAPQPQLDRSFGSTITPGALGAPTRGNTIVNNNTTVVAPGVDADVAREIDQRQARSVARYR